MTRPLITVRGARGSEDVTPVDADRGHRSLSVAEMQQALRELQALKPRSAHLGTGSHRDPDDTPRSAPQAEGSAPRHSRESRERKTRDQLRGDTGAEQRSRRGDRPAGGSQTGGDSGDLPTAWITVLAAHAGAGASTVALAISDAVAESGRSAHLVEDVPPSRSGLVAAASAELGPDAAGSWRRGLRSNVTIDRRGTEAPPTGWPVLPAGHASAVTVIDLGLVDGRQALPQEDRTNIVVVCRPTVPGVRLTERLLDQLAQQPVVVAAIGPSRWPGEVTASVGPRLQALRDAGGVVAVPIDRRLAVVGLTSSPLPKPIQAAGRALLGLLDHDIRAARPSTATTRPAPTRERARR